MGWDAYAEPVKRLYEHKDGRNGLANPAHDAAFIAADRRATKVAGTADGLLRQGGLDCSDCERVLREATGLNTYPDRAQGQQDVPWDWAPSTVEAAARTASSKWGLLLLDHEPWAVWSVREFLETCAKLGLGVRFSW